MTIAAVKPSGNAANGPRWATVSPGTVRLDPTSGQKDTGWTNGQRPPFNVMNWILGVGYDWQQYLEDATDQIDSTKLNRDGTGAAGVLSGTILPSATDTVNLGQASTRFQEIHAKLFVGAASIFVPASRKGIQISDGLGSAAKLFMASDATVEGDFKPDGAATRDLGSSGARWDDVFFDSEDVNAVLINTTLTMGASARLASDLLPSANNTRDLGSASLRWSDVFSTNIDSNTIAVNTSILPVTSAAAVSNGTLAKSWGSVVSRDIQARTARWYRSTQPATQADFAFQTRLTTIMAAVRQTSTSASPTIAISSVQNYNGDTSALSIHPSIGTYVIKLLAQVPSLSCITLVTPNTGNTTATATLTGTGDTVDVTCRDGTTGVLKDSAFSLLIVGDHGQIDPVT